MRLREHAGAPKGDGELPGLSLISFYSNDTKLHVTHLLKEAKSTFLTDFISQNSDNQGKSFRAVKNLLVAKNSLCFSDYTDKSALANEIGKYFVQKISQLCEELDQGYVPNDQGYVMDDSVVNSDSIIPPTRNNNNNNNNHLFVLTIYKIITINIKLV